MNILDLLKRFWTFLKEDSWQSWIVSLILAFVLIKFVFFPLLSFAMGTSLPLVVVESCSMYHQTGFDQWWNDNAAWYERNGITKSDFREFSFKGGLNKGDIILVSGRGGYELGDIIIFNSDFKFPLIHRVVELESATEEDEGMLGTKGDNNFDQLPNERDIDPEQVLGKSVARVPGLGWVKLIFFEPLKPEGERGFCK